MSGCFDENTKLPIYNILENHICKLEKRIEELESKMKENKVFYNAVAQTLKDHRENLDKLNNNLDACKINKEIDNKIKFISMSQATSEPFYGLIEKILADLPTYKQGEKIIATKEDIDKHKSKKQKFKLHDRVICYSYERFVGRISAIDIDKYRIENDEHDGYWVHEKQIRRIKKK